ncbi:MAG: hypothetical protein IJC23_03845 [Bacteroidaceae bacterium]|nr:hypothetical protein [Bacteroidaceae bacterium]
MLSKKLLVPSKKNVIYLTFITLLCGCREREREKTIYKVPLSEHMAELRQQERAYMDSLEKYSALSDTAQIQYYFVLHKTVLDTLGVVMQQEVDAFMATKDREAANEENSSMTTELILLGVAIVLLIATIIYVSITTLFWTRLGWFFEDAWHWLKRRRIIRRLTDPRYCSLINGPFVKDEDLTDEDIHEIMNLIHKGNPPKYEIKRKEESSKVLGRSKRQSRASKED